MTKYKLINERASSNKYGKCEICGKYVDSIYHQIEYKKYKSGWLVNKELFGHKKDDIIAMRDVGFTIRDIANRYGVSASAICNNLAKWKFYDKPKKSEWLKARQAENTKINDSKIEYIEFERSTEDQRLVSSILCRSIIG